MPIKTNIPRNKSRIGVDLPDAYWRMEGLQWHQDGIIKYVAVAYASEQAANDGAQSIETREIVVGPTAQPVKRDEQDNLIKGAVPAFGELPPKFQNALKAVIAQGYRLIKDRDPDLAAGTDV